LVDYDRIFSRIDKIGVSKAFVCDELGKSRSWLQVYGHSDASLKADAMERIHNVGKASKDKNAASDGENE